MPIIFNIHLTKQTIMKDSTQNSNNSNRHENAYAVYQKKDSVLYITFKKLTVLNLDAAKKVVKDRMNFQAYACYNVICDVSGLTSITYDARQYLSTDGSNMLTVVALVSDNTTIYTMGRCYLLYNHPTVPTRIFKNQQEAEKYINQITKKP